MRLEGRQTATTSSGSGGVAFFHRGWFGSGGTQQDGDEG